MKTDIQCKKGIFHFLIGLIFLILSTGPVFACGTCVYTAMVGAFPFMKSWALLFILWVACAATIRVITDTLSTRATINVLSGLAIAMITGAIMLGLLPLMIVMVIWFLWYVKLFIESRAYRLPRAEKALLYSCHLLMASLLVAAFITTPKSEAAWAYHKLGTYHAHGSYHSYLNDVGKRGVLSDRELIEMAQNGTYNQRYNAVKVMGLTGKESFVPAIIEIMQQEPEDDIRDGMGDALEKLTGEKLGKDSLSWKKWWNKNRSTWSGK